MKKVIATLIAMVFMASMASALVLKPVKHHGKTKTELMSSKRAEKEAAITKWRERK